MKKIFTVFFIIFISFNLFSLRTEEVQEHSYDSKVLIDKFYQEQELSDFLREYWDSVSISLVTMSKGPELYSWFGHTAVMVDFPDDTSYVFDYGRFFFDKEFYENFLKGNLWYWCGCSFTSYLTGKCVESHRNMTCVTLDLSPEEKRALVSFLEDNIQEENCTYSYNPYSDNCSTRVRDILNRITEGDFEKWAKAQSGMTFRDQSSRILYASPVLQWFIDALQGRRTDLPVTRWEEIFLPENLEQALIEYGKLGSEKSYIVDSRETDMSIPNKDVPTYRYGVYSLVSLLLVLLSVLLFRKKKIWAGFTFSVNLILGVLGCVILFVMFFTEHFEMSDNENLIFINPILLVLAVLSFKRERHLKALEILYFIYAELTLLLIVAKIILPGVFIQKNLCQIIVVLPFYLANWFMILRSEQAGLNCKKCSSAEDSNPLE